MRHDMGKAANERARGGSSVFRGTHNWLTATRGNIRIGAADDGEADACPPPNGSSRPRQRMGLLNAWADEPFAKTRSGNRALYRFLVSRVGRPWNEVHGELAATLDRRNAVARRLWSDVTYAVKQHCCFGPDGQIYDYSRGHTCPVTTGLFVHPETGALCHASSPRPRADRAGRHLGDRLRALGLLNYGRPEPRAADWRFIDDLHVLERRAAGWFLHTFRRLDPDDLLSVKKVGDRDVPVTRRDTPGAPTTERVATRQIGRRDTVLWSLVSGRIAQNPGADRPGAAS